MLTSVAVASYEEEFGQIFAPNDGDEFHFKRLASHTATAESLERGHGANMQTMLAVASAGVSFDVENPYPDGSMDYVYFDGQGAQLTVDVGDTTDFA